MRCWGSSKGLAVALCWSPGLRRPTRQRLGWTGTGKNAKQGSRTYLGMVNTVLGARQTPSYLQIRVVFAGSLSLSGKMGRVGCDKCKCRVAAPMGIRVSRRQQAVTCKSLPRTRNGGRWGDSIWVSALRGLGFSAQPQTPNHQEQIGRNLVYFLEQVSIRIQSYQSSIRQIGLSSRPLVSHIMSRKKIDFIPSRTPTHIASRHLPAHA